MKTIGLNWWNELKSSIIYYRIMNELVREKLGDAFVQKLNVFY